VGIPLDSVRIHTDTEAARLNQAVGAHAFAIGEHIAFNHGRFAPDQPAGRHLLAHELAHVAQHRQQAGTLEQTPVRRGFWSDLYDSAAETLGDIADWAWDQVQEFGWRLVRSISPEFERSLRAILDEGILVWLGRQVAHAWDAYIGTLRALVPFDGPRQLIDLFAGMVERAAAIVAALASGDCAPLMAAIDSLKTCVVSTAHRIPAADRRILQRTLEQLRSARRTLAAGLRRRRLGRHTGTGAALLGVDPAGARGCRTGVELVQGPALRLLRG